MAGGFKLFIDTHGKSKDEIKSGIRQLLEKRIQEAEKPCEPHNKESAPSNQGEICHVIEDVTDDSKKEYVYSSQPIPMRDLVDYNTGEKVNTTSSESISFSPNLFSAQFSESDRIINAIITEMRSLNEVYYNGYLLKQCAQVSIVRQGDFLAGLTDNYKYSAFCGISRPTYGAMSNSQLRTYITWRTKARKGQYNATDEPYVMLYCYELLNKIGVASSAEAFAKLIEVNEKCGKFAGEVKRLIPRWLKDFYAFNNISAQYPDINDILKTSCGIKNDEVALRKKEYFGQLDYFMKNSAYDLEKSAFFSEGTKPLLDGAVGAVMTELDAWLDKKGISLFELICGKMKKQFGWEPFKGAFVNLDRMDGFREIKINEVERYCIKRREPVLECFEAIPYRGFIGYVLKRVEAVVRKQSGFRHRITPNINMLLNDLCNREKFAKAVSEPAFGECIDNAAQSWCIQNGIVPPSKERKVQKAEADCALAKPICVEIDMKKLNKIREESDEIAKRLIIEDEGLAEEEIERLSEQVDCEDYGERVTAFTQETEEVCPLQEEPAFDFSELPSAWEKFALALSENELLILAAALRGTAEDSCRNMGLFPETVYEKINTTALEMLGDIIIECGEIIPDYQQYINKIAKIIDY